MPPLRHIRILTAGSPAQGYGHLMRMLSLAEALREGNARVEFELLSEDRASASRIHEAQFPMVTATTAPDWVVIDVPDRRDAMSKGSHHATSKIALVDDGGFPDKIPCHLIVNQNAGATRIHYPGMPDDVRFLLGTDYTMLSSRFRTRSWRNREAGASNPFRLLITLGGGQTWGYARDILHALANARPAQTSIRVFSADAPANANTLFSFPSDTTIHVAAGTNDMAAELDAADFAVIAGGTTVWEAFCAGTPVGVILIADNQKPHCEVLHREGAFAFLSDARQSLSSPLADQLRQSLHDDNKLRRLTAAGRARIDGQGALRVAAQLN